MAATFTQASRLIAVRIAPGNYLKPDDLLAHRVFVEEAISGIGEGLSRCEAEYYSQIKDIRKVQSQGYLLEHITIIDDSPERISRQPRNHLKVKPFHGQPDDSELLLIMGALLQHDRLEQE